MKFLSLPPDRWLLSTTLLPLASVEGRIFVVITVPEVVPPALVVETAAALVPSEDTPRFRLFGKFPQLFCRPVGRLLSAFVDPDSLVRPRLLFCIPPRFCAFKSFWIGWAGIGLAGSSWDHSQTASVSEAVVENPND